ncbi:hypothetical protein AVDCRST_MAG84-2307 [uncultured Microcoleus sp.]|uniref:Uncharacterized protein n=1 Tax=uncultured Microcoleus sp. TaxID=259945 RepID=A0A6J4LR90_9CYAN|nr:hypothetical protein AVDCRST_MAG84-2307 [uncultured Microcoleus sp.]
MPTTGGTPVPRSGESRPISGSIEIYGEIFNLILSSSVVWQEPNLS